MKSIKITRITTCNLSESEGKPAEMLARIKKYPNLAVAKDIIKIEINGLAAYFYATPNVEIELLIS